MWFGLGLQPGLADVSQLLPRATAADAAGLDVVSIPDHPNYANQIDAYAALGMVLGATRRISGVVNLTNIGIRSAPLLARTVASLSALSDRRIVLGIGAGSLWDELGRLGVTPRSPAESVQAMEETITVVRALTGGGQPVDFAGRFDQIHFKLYAMADGLSGKHEADLRDLQPTEEELLTAARWTLTHDPSDGFRSLLLGALASLGVDDADLIA